MQTFTPKHLESLFRPAATSSKEQNGQVTIIGGSDLFHGAPLLSLITASRIVDIVFFATPDKGVGETAQKLKSRLLSFIWIPWGQVGEYLKKSDAALIGPGLKRYHKEGRQPSSPHLDSAGTYTKRLTQKLLRKYPQKQWVIDAGALQVVNPSLIPQNAILTPNQKEFALLFGKIPPSSSINQTAQIVEKQAQKYHCIISYKAPASIVSDGKRTFLIKNGNPGLTKGGTGDVLAGLTCALAAKNPPLFAAPAAAYLTKAAADDLARKLGTHYNADDLAAQLPLTFHRLTSKL